MRSLYLVLSLVLLSACGGKEAGPTAPAGAGAPASNGAIAGAGAGTAPGTTAGIPASGATGGTGTATGSNGSVAAGASGAAETLLWKRGTALGADLGRALSLSAAELCTEVSDTPCLEVHRAPLGRSDPFGTGLLEPVQRPLATSALATERVALSACSARVDKDRAGAPAVFVGVDLGDQRLPADPTSLRGAAEKLAALLYPRLLSRVPTSAEVEVLAELATGGDGKTLSARSYAKLACFAIATTSEFVLY